MDVSCNYFDSVFKMLIALIFFSFQLNLNSLTTLGAKTILLAIRDNSESAIDTLELKARNFAELFTFKTFLLWCQQIRCIMYICIKIFDPL